MFHVVQFVSKEMVTMEIRAFSLFSLVFSYTSDSYNTISLQKIFLKSYASLNGLFQCLKPSGLASFQLQKTSSDVLASVSESPTNCVCELTEHLPL